MKHKHNSKLHAFLDEQGVLEHGSEDDIRAAKRVYWKSYYKRYRTAQRAEKPEYNVALSRKNGVYGKVALAAKRHKMTITQFLRTATLAYLDRQYVCPNIDQVQRIERLLMDCLNEIKVITTRRDRYQYEREQKLDVIAERIARLETDIRQALVFPPEKQ